MARPKHLKTILEQDQIALWSEQGIDPEPLPLGMLKDWIGMFTNCRAEQDVMGMRRSHQSIIELMHYIRPDRHVERRDIWDELTHEFSRADAGNTPPA
jgi:hypothetical protein